MAEFDRDNRIQSYFNDSGSEQADFEKDQDLLMEQILDNVRSSPIGQVLRKIASLPEVRQKKVLDVRRRITQGEYEVDDRLNMALDKVLEELIA